MTLKGQKTVADYVEWNEISGLIMKLERDGNYTFCLVCTFGAFWGLRISEILSLKWDDVFGKPDFTIKAAKGAKERKIEIVPDVQKLIARMFEQFHGAKKTDYIFLSQVTGKPMTSQNVNQQLKNIRAKYNLPVENFSSHSLRKTFGRHFLHENNYSDYAYTLLGEIFRHKDAWTTKRYLGITNEEISNVYQSFKF